MTMPRDWPYKAKNIDNNGSKIVPSDSSNETEDKDRDQLIFDLIKRRYDSELEINNSFDTKASSLVGFVSILIGLLFVSGTFELSVITSNPILSTSYFLGTSLLVGSIIFSLLAFRIRRFIIVPDVNQLLNDYSDRPYLEVLKRTGATMQVAVEDIEKKNADKAKWIRISWYSLMVGIVILFVFLGLYATIGMEIKNAQ
jgi:hypothetical protein